MKTSINIIIASRNREKYIKDLLLDLNQQSIPADKILIIDQSDVPYQLFQDAKVDHIIDKERGPCHARNLGLERATGDILVFLDDDIRIESNFLYHLCNPIIQGKYQAVVGAMCNQDGVYPTRVSPNWKKPQRNWLLAITVNPDHHGEDTTLSFTTCCSAIHRSIYLDIGGFDPFFDPDGAGEDREYGLRIFHAGYQVLFEGKAAVRHLGARSGGRRDANTGLKYQNILEANSVYIVAKYFNWQVFESFCREFLWKILQKGLVLNPTAWVRTCKRWYEARCFVEKIRKIKRLNNW